ncbi:hypothetical protein Tco_0870284 [Tanacetum coccineum]
MLATTRSPSIPTQFPIITIKPSGPSLRVFRASSSVTSSIWGSIVREVDVLKSQGVDLISHCKRRIGNGMNTSFWNDVWIGDRFYMTPRRLSQKKALNNPLWHQLQELVGPTILSNSADRLYGI